MHRLIAALLLTTGIAVAAPKPDDPFFPDLVYADGRVTVTFDLTGPGEHLYDDMFACSLGIPVSKPVTSTDPDGRLTYGGMAVFVWEATPGTTFTVDYQGCDADQCLFPQSRTFSITHNGTVIEGKLPAEGAILHAPFTANPGDSFFPQMTYSDGKLTAVFDLSGPGEHIYDDMLVCTLGAPIAKPAADADPDGRLIYGGADTTFVWKASPGMVFTLEYQGCDAEQCLFPQSYTIAITPDGTLTHASGTTPATAEAVSGEETSGPDFPTASRTLSGYVEADEFVAFLEGTRELTFADDPIAFVRTHGMVAFVLLVFLGGLLLNLTPCVLPMIPINLAIIGAGAAGGSRLRGALRGGAYGLGITVAYGVLALIPVLTGAAFGAIQSAWWFNAAIAGVFVLLALALFDVFMIDFTRFSGPGSGRKGALAAFAAGSVSAILAGACVAPVLIAVLLLTSTYVAEGIHAALCLPFVLGLGMALPWPIAGAGLSFLPKPGAWMLWVKKIFGIVVLLFALYYAFVAYRALFPASPAAEQPLAGAIETDASSPESLLKAIGTAKAGQKAVFLDFWGPACKNCELMEATTFRDASVQEALKAFAVIKVRMDLNDRRIETVKQAYGVQGLPTYVIIEAE